MLVGDAGLAGDIQRAPEERFHVLDDVARRVDVGPVVHGDHCCAMSGSGGRDVRLALKAPDVVDDGRPSPERRLRCLGLVGVDGHRRKAACHEPLDDRHHAGHLFLCRNFGRARSSGLATDVKDVGAFVGHVAGVGEGGFNRGVASAVGKAVRRDVEDAHNQCSLAEVWQKGKDHGHARIWRSDF